MTNIAVFASGNGSNAVNLVRTFNSGNRIHVALCLTDREDAPVIDKMKELGVETIYFPRSVWKQQPQVILDTLRLHDIKMIALAGFLCFVSDEIVDEFEGRILNIHPSLLPAYGGKGMHGSNIHKAVIEAGETRSGATVHVVTKEIDAGPVVVQREVTVLPDDTPESLEAKVHEMEYQIFPEAILKLLNENSTTPQPQNSTTSQLQDSTTSQLQNSTTSQLQNSTTSQLQNSTTPQLHNSTTSQLQNSTTSQLQNPTTPQLQNPTTPPPLPKSVDDAWAEALGIPNNVPPAPQPSSQLPLQGAGGLPGVPSSQLPLQGAGGLPGVPSSQLPLQGAGGPNPAMPPTFLVWSVIMTILCCTIPGIVAIIYSAQVSSKFYQGDFEAARRASERAEIWIIVSFVLGVLSNTLYLPLAIAGAF